MKDDTTTRVRPHCPVHDCELDENKGCYKCFEEYNDYLYWVDAVDRDMLARVVINEQRAWAWMRWVLFETDDDDIVDGIETAMDDGSELWPPEGNTATHCSPAILVLPAQKPTGCRSCSSGEVLPFGEICARCFWLSLGCRMLEAVEGTAEDDEERIVIEGVVNDILAVLGAETPYDVLESAAKSAYAAVMSGDMDAGMKEWRDKIDAG